MYKPVQTCTHCGANLTLEHMRGTECPYCKTVFPHHSMAAQHAQVSGQVMNQMMAQQAQVQNQWRGAFGVGPMPPAGVPPGMPGGPPGTPGASGSPYGAPYGAPGSPYGAPGSPYGDPNRIAQAHMAHVHTMQRGIQRTVMFSLIGVFLLVGGILLVTMLL